MKTAALLLLVPAALCGQGGGCAQLHSLVQSTYRFKPSMLSKAQQQSKSVEMDRVWNLVEDKPSEMAPCLMAEMELPDADGWFLFDGGTLLAKLDHSERARRLILRGCEQVDLADVSLADWVRKLTALALADVDISAAADRWMRYPRAQYTVTEHSYPVRLRDGAFFLYSSMDERLAVPALLKIVNDRTHPQRELALALLGQAVTPEGDAAFQAVDLSGFPVETQNAARGEIGNRPVFERRRPAQSTREELLKVFHAAADDRDFGPFQKFAEKTPDGERDAVTVMTAEDVPLIRRVRRAIAASGNPELIDDYPYFTGIIWTILKGR